MMKLMWKTKGSISIFLLLVLLPMVTYATLVIDVSRIQSARTVITGAGDLSMNAALSEYELTLQNMYGLFGQVTSEEKFEKALEQYFRETIEGTLAQGGGEDKAYIEDFSKDFAAFLVQRDEEITEDDMINFLVMQVDSYEAMSVDGTALANPAMMKKQIIDYMKYRGPVSLGSSLMKKIGFFGGAAKQAKAAEAKIEYTEELDKINDPCKQAYADLMGTQEDKTQEQLEQIGGKNMGYYQSALNYNKYLSSNSDLKDVFAEVKDDYTYAFLRSIRKLVYPKQ